MHHTHGMRRITNLPARCRAAAQLAAALRQGDDPCQLYGITAGDSGEESDDDFDARLAKIRKNEMAPGGQRKAKTPYEQLQENKKVAASGNKDRDWGPETVIFESAPHRGDLAINIALGATLLWLPLTFAALGRGAFVKYRFSDKRISVITSAPWKSACTCAFSCTAPACLKDGRSDHSPRCKE